MEVTNKWVQRWCLTGLCFGKAFTNSSNSKVGAFFAFPVR